MYERAKKNLNEMIKNKMLFEDNELSFFLWEITFKEKNKLELLQDLIKTNIKPGLL